MGAKSANPASQPMTERMAHLVNELVVYGFSVLLAA
jgi:hypothetical protein